MADDDADHPRSPDEGEAEDGDVDRLVDVIESVAQGSVSVEGCATVALSPLRPSAPEPQLSTPGPNFDSVRRLLRPFSREPSVAGSDTESMFSCEDDLASCGDDNEGGDLRAVARMASLVIRSKERRIERACRDMSRAAELGQQLVAARRVGDEKLRDTASELDVLRVRLADATAERDRLHAELVVFKGRDGMAGSDVESGSDVDGVSPRERDMTRVRRALVGEVLAEREQRKQLARSIGAYEDVHRDQAEVVESLRSELQVSEELRLRAAELLRGEQARAAELEARCNELSKPADPDCDFAAAPATPPPASPKESGAAHALAELWREEALQLRRQLRRSSSVAEAAPPPAPQQRDACTQRDTEDLHSRLLLRRLQGLVRGVRDAWRDAREAVAEAVQAAGQAAAEAAADLRAAAEKAPSPPLPLPPPASLAETAQTLPAADAVPDTAELDEELQRLRRDLRLLSDQPADDAGLTPLPPAETEERRVRRARVLRRIAEVRTELHRRCRDTSRPRRPAADAATQTAAADGEELRKSLRDFRFGSAPADADAESQQDAGEVVELQLKLEGTVQALHSEQRRSISLLDEMTYLREGLRRAEHSLAEGRKTAEEETVAARREVEAARRDVEAAERDAAAGKQEVASLAADLERERELRLVLEETERCRADEAQARIEEEQAMREREAELRRAAEARVSQLESEQLSLRNAESAARAQAELERSDAARERRWRMQAEASLQSAAAPAADAASQTAATCTRTGSVQASSPEGQPTQPREAAGTQTACGGASVSVQVAAEAADVLTQCGGSPVLLPAVSGSLIAAPEQRREAASGQRREAASEQRREATAEPSLQVRRLEGTIVRLTDEILSLREEVAILQRTQQSPARTAAPSPASSIHRPTYLHRLATPSPVLLGPDRAAAPSPPCRFIVSGSAVS
eukprot:TRINITY_DN6943_c0_g1_i1.p1 TRINITY_DN6943_c0_g1~~TRINITY_DN6943_c0_g1_i1.p1  ORF type:complete len:931 (+),score=410.67 TRINITY_DN6943_c0_g1_i1:120-2912(+)